MEVSPKVVAFSKIPSLSIASRIPSGNTPHSQLKPRTVSILDNSPVAASAITGGSDVQTAGPKEVAEKHPFTIPVLNLAELNPSCAEMTTPPSSAAPSNTKLPGSNSPRSKRSAGKPSSQNPSPVNKQPASHARRHSVSSPKVVLSPRVKDCKVAFGRASASPSGGRSSTIKASPLRTSSEVQAANQHHKEPEPTSILSSLSGLKSLNSRPQAVNRSVSTSKVRASGQGLNVRSTSVEKFRNTPLSASKSRSISVDKHRPTLDHSLASTSNSFLGRTLSTEKSRPNTAAPASRGLSSDLAAKPQFQRASQARLNHTGPSPLRVCSSSTGTRLSGGAVPAVPALKPLAAIHERTDSSALAFKPAVLVTMEAEEKPKNLKPAPPLAVNAKPRPQGLALNLGTLKASTLQEDADIRPDSASATSMATLASIPKLDLQPVIQQRDEEQGGHAAAGQGEAAAAPPYKVAASSGSQAGSSGSKSVVAAGKKSSNSLSKSKEEPVDHFYYYPKLDSKEEKQTLDVISALPKQHASQMKKIYHTMVEAKQNCEAIAFRGHRLLDQLNSHMKEQLNKANEREGELQKQLTDYQAKHEQQQQQLNSLMLVLQGMQGLSLAGGMGGGGIGSLLSSLCVGGLNSVDNPEGDAPEHLSSGVNLSSPDADAAAAMMDQVRVLHAEMSSVQHCVNQLSSRLGGVAVLPHKKTLSSFNEGADVGYLFDTQQLTHGGMHTSSSKAVIKEARLTDDLMPENDID